MVSAGAAVVQRLGRLIVLTDAVQAPAGLVAVTTAAVRAGARTFVLREKHLPRRARLALAEQLRQILEPVGGTLIVAGPDGLGGDAVHLAASDRPARGQLSRERVGGVASDITDVVTTTSVMSGWVGRSCHGAQEMQQLSNEDYIFVSPVFITPSKPGYGPALGLDGLSRLCELAGRPVYALGGIRTAEQVAACLRAGAAGVAVMGEIMRSTDPAHTVRSMLAALAGGTASGPEPGLRRGVMA